MKIILSLLAFLVFATAQASETPIHVIPSHLLNTDVSPIQLISLVKENFKVDQYREVRVKLISDEAHHSLYVLVYLFSKKFHSFDMARVNINNKMEILSILRNYHSTREELLLQNHMTVDEAVCPDRSIEFIAFAPNDDDFEQQVTIDVAKVAQEKGLKVISLLRSEATHDAYLNYMACPNLKGNFYDGDANPSVITTVDGEISSEEFSTLLKNKFRFKVTNIWLACEAFNDPIRSSLIETDQSQKYAAGINDLEIGPSDNAAACAMKAAIGGAPMTAAFQDCVKKFDTPSDQWGYDGHGSDFFGL